MKNANVITIILLFFTSLFLIASNVAKPITSNKLLTYPVLVVKEIVKVKYMPDIDTVVIPKGLPVLEEVLDRPKENLNGFGYRLNPFNKSETQFHPGVDIGCPIGSEVLSTADGKVVRVQFKPTGYGVNIIVEHNNSYKTLYAHLSKVVVKVGEHIKQGQVIAYSGNTGMSTSPHLHYEVLVLDQREDPKKFF